jgi:hypothetical protein
MPLLTKTHVNGWRRAGFISMIGTRQNKPIGEVMKVYTNIKILKRAWSILKELELEGLLSGGKVKVDFMKVVEISKNLL